MRLRLTILLVFALLTTPLTMPLGWATPPATPAPTQVPMSGKFHGVNLGAGLMFASCEEMVFADLMRSAGNFNGYRGTPPSPQYDPQGWPTKVDAATGSTTLAFALNAMLPAGDYTITAKGTGTVQVSGSFTGSTAQGISTLKFVSSDTAQILKRANPGIPYGNQLVMTVTASSATDPIRDVSFFLPGHVGKTFYQPFLDDLAPFAVLRTMDWQTTNGSKLSTWDDREAAKTKFSIKQNGRVPEEVAIELANTLDKDLWICIPALADDDYIIKLARLFDTTLEPGRGIYVEFSNELWNNFPQAGQLAIERNKRPQRPTRVPIKPDVDAAPVTGGWEYVARVDGHDTNLFHKHITSGRKCTRVLARQAGYAGTITLAMNQYKADGYKFDAISGACYFYSKGVDFNAAATLYKTDPEAAKAQVFAGIDKSIPEFTNYLVWWKTQADLNKVRLMCYEGGQHLAASMGNDGPTALLIAVNRDKRMGAAYQKLIDTLPVGTGPICWFNSTGLYSKWGYWGLKERTGQSLGAAPKYATVLADATANPPPVEPPPVEPPVVIPPTPPVDPVDPPIVVEPVVPTVPLPITVILEWLKMVGIDGFVNLNDDGSYTATLSDPRPLGFRTQKLVIPTP